MNARYCNDPKLVFCQKLRNSPHSIDGDRVYKSPPMSLLSDFQINVIRAGWLPIIRIVFSISILWRHLPWIILWSVIAQVVINEWRMRKDRSFPTTLRSTRVSTWHKKEYIDFYKKILHLIFRNTCRTDTTVNSCSKWSCQQNRKVSKQQMYIFL